MSLLRSLSVHLACRYVFFSPWLRGKAEKPRLYGADVFVPAKLVESIPRYDPKSPIYAACNDNGWFEVQSGVVEELKERFRMKPSGDGAYFIAFNMKGKKFYPVQIGPDNEARWARYKVSTS
jgi:hypothetical protein